MQVLVTPIVFRGLYNRLKEKYGNDSSYYATLLFSMRAVLALQEQCGYSGVKDIVLSTGDIVEIIGALEAEHDKAD